LGKQQWNFGNIWRRRRDANEAGERLIGFVNDNRRRKFHSLPNTWPVLVQSLSSVR